MEVVCENKLKSHLEWDNSDVSEFYENVPIDELKKFTQIGGLDTCCDIDLIRTYINKSNSILEVGAGYGRVIENILAHGYQQKLTAIERSHRLCQHIKNQFDNKITLIEDDLIKHKFTEKYDLILFMWSNISEYPKAKQLNTLKYLQSLLTEHGVLIVETFDKQTTPKNSTAFNDGFYVYSSEYGTTYGYIPSPDEIYQHGEKLGFKKITQSSYHTSTNRKRFITIFSDCE